MNNVNNVMTMLSELSDVQKELKVTLADLGIVNSLVSAADKAYNVVFNETKAFAAEVSAKNKQLQKKWADLAETEKMLAKEAGTMKQKLQNTLSTLGDVPEAASIVKESISSLNTYESRGNNNASKALQHSKEDLSKGI